MKKVISLRLELILFGLMVAFFWFNCIFHYVSLDFWYDEVNTLNRYVFNPVRETMTNYSAPNNHIFFNIINNIYLKINGINNIYEASNHTVLVRCLMLFYASLALFFHYLFTRKIAEPCTALLSLSILISTLPFYNFATQIRGYGLSILLFSMLNYCALTYRDSKKFFLLPAVAIMTALLLYTIPSNLYFILSMLCFFLLSGTLGFYSSSKESSRKNEPIGATAKYNSCFFIVDFKICLAMFAGILLAILFYAPVLKRVINNPYVQSEGLFRFPTLAEILPTTLWYFFSYRYVLVIFGVLGLFFLLKNIANNKQLNYVLFFCLTVLFLPFVISFVRGDKPFYRTFITLSPIFATLIALVFHNLIHISRRFTIVLMLLIIVTCFPSFYYALSIRNHNLINAMKEGVISQNIFSNYYQYRYNPEKIAKVALNSTNQGQIPVGIFEGDKVAMPFYLSKHKVPAYSLDKLDRILINRRGQALVITSDPSTVIAIFNRKAPHATCKIVSTPLMFHNIVRCDIQLE